MEIYRLHRSVRAAADYTGAMLAGGRWNPIGTPMLYRSPPSSFQGNSTSYSAPATPAITVSYGARRGHSGLIHASSSWSRKHYSVSDYRLRVNTWNGLQ